MKHTRSGTSEPIFTPVPELTNFLTSVFTAAAISIKVKLYKDDGDEDTVRRYLRLHHILTVCHQDTAQLSGSSTLIDRTSTGIISNKPRKVGLPALETLIASKSMGMGVMALAKRESARRNLYSQFFRGPVLGTDTEEPQSFEVAQRLSPSHSEPNDPRCKLSIKEQRKGKKRKSWEEGEEATGLTQKKRKSKRENEIKGGRKERKRLKKDEEKGEVPEVRLGGKVESEPKKMARVPESSTQDDLGNHSRRKDRKKNRKRKDRENAVRHDG